GVEQPEHGVGVGLAVNVGDAPVIPDDGDVFRLSLPACELDSRTVLEEWSGQQRKDGASEREVLHGKPQRNAKAGVVRETAKPLGSHCEAAKPPKQRESHWEAPKPPKQSGRLAQPGRQLGPARHDHEYQEEAGARQSYQEASSQGEAVPGP